jgi:hypothetical protein
LIAVAAQQQLSVEKLLAPRLSELLFAAESAVRALASTPLER